MQIIRTLFDRPKALSHAIAAIGNFDGVHKGHLAILDHVKQIAARSGRPSSVLTFSPHPRRFFQPHIAPFELMSPAAKHARLAALGLDAVFDIPFNGDLAQLSAHAFAQDILKEGLDLSHVIVGDDFHFGKGRAGTPDTLRALGADLGFDVTVMPEIDLDGGRISSSTIRAALAKGDLRTANAMLGHRHRYQGPVIHGEKRGRELGYPTANMDVTGLHLAKFGVYAVEVTVCDGPHQGRYHGAASLGVRPMFGENTPNLETFIFDFKGDLYGAEVSIALVEFLRPEENFASLEGLMDQMAHDCATARAILETTCPI